jgi:hypothetical protein
MSYDIFIETQDDTQPGCYALGRRFCWLVSLLDEPEPEAAHASELIQLYALYSLRPDILQKMNVYRFIIQEPRTVHDLEKFHTAMAEAFQPAAELLENLITLYARICEKPGLLEEIQPNNEWIQSYFERFSEDVGERLVDRNLGWDLRTIITYLQSLPEGTLIRFGYL